jgi:hypothetical protein
MMPASDYDERLLGEVQMTHERGHWQVHARYDGQRYQFGTFLTYAEAHHACSASVIEKALGSPQKRVMRQIREELQPTPQVAPMSPLEGTTSGAQLQHREAFWQFVLHEAEPRHRERLARLLDVWEEANHTYYAGVLVRPIILLAEPSNPRRLGDCGPVSGWGAQSQIRIRPSLLEGTHPMLAPGRHDPEGLFRLAADVLIHEQIHQWQQEVTGKGEESYHGHGPGFCAQCNEIGARLDLAQVIVKTRPGQRGMPRCTQWPHNVRPAEYYRGVYVPTGGDDDT